MLNLRVPRAFAVLASASAFVLGSLAAALAARPASADEHYHFVIKKQEEKAKSRWSLQEWLDTRDRMRMMDLWLALHSPSPYEFFVSGAYRAGELSSASPSAGQGSYAGSDLAAAAYASIFGLGFEREGGAGTRYSGLFHLRVFGYHYQSTHIRLEGGLRQEDGGGGVRFRQPVAGAGLAIYLGKHFGLDGLYRHGFAATANQAGAEFTGNRLEGGAFIDFSFVRVFGKYVHEKLSTDSTTLAPDTVRSGPQAGLTLFF